MPLQYLIHCGQSVLLKSHSAGRKKGRENSPYTHLHFHAPPFSSVIFCSLSSKAEITLFLQAEQIVAKLMMNMAAVDKRLAEEQNRQAMVITLK